MSKTPRSSNISPLNTVIEQDRLFYDFLLGFRRTICTFEVKHPLHGEWRIALNGMLLPEAEVPPMAKALPPSATIIETEGQDLTSPPPMPESLSDMEDQILKNMEKRKNLDTTDYR